MDVWLVVFGRFDTNYTRTPVMTPQHVNHAREHRREGTKLLIEGGLAPTLYIDDVDN